MATKKIKCLDSKDMHFFDNKHARPWASAKCSTEPGLQFMGASIICRGMGIIVGM